MARNSFQRSVSAASAKVATTLITSNGSSTRPPQ
jgi:hypothetical protein